jgi:hypothetical protein
MVGEQAQQSITQLPVWETVGHAYKAFFDNLSGLLRATWPWLIVLGLLTVLAGWLGVDYQLETIEAAKTQRPMPSQPFALTAVQIGNGLAYIVGGAVMAVGWHRFLLLNEPQRFGSNVFSGPMWRYVGAGALMTLVALIPMLITMVVVWSVRPPMSVGVAGTPVPGASTGLSAASGLLIIPALIWAAMLGTRLLLSLPARALGHNQLNFRAVWQQTKGNTWRIGFGVFLCAFPIMLLVQGIVAAYMYSSMPDLRNSEAVAAWMSSLAIPNGILTSLYVLTSMISVAFLSFAYRHFFAPPNDGPLRVRQV